MFKFLKGLFKEKEAEKAIVEKSKLAEWFTDYSKELLDENKDKIRNNFQQIKNAINEGKNGVKALLDSELQNKKIPTRMLQIMEGNRQSYAKRVNLFFNNILLTSL